MPANVAQQGRSALRTMVPRLYGVREPLEQWIPISRSASRLVFLVLGFPDLSRFASSFV